MKLVQKTIKKIAGLGQRGDTIVEVLLATVIMSAVLSTAYNLSNRATKINQDSYERITIANSLQEQAELLRVARAQDTTHWANAKAKGSGVTADPAGPDNCFKADFNDTTTFTTTKSYHMNLVGGEAQIVDGPLGPIGGQEYYIWIDSVGNTTGGFIEFVINACWPGLGADVNYETGVVLRLEVT